MNCLSVQKRFRLIKLYALSRWNLVCLQRAAFVLGWSSWLTIWSSLQRTLMRKLNSRRMIQTINGSGSIGMESSLKFIRSSSLSHAPTNVSVRSQTTSTKNMAFFSLLLRSSSMAKRMERFYWTQEIISYQGHFQRRMSTSMSDTF